MKNIIKKNPKKATKKITKRTLQKISPEKGDAILFVSKDDLDLVMKFSQMDGFIGALYNDYRAIDKFEDLPEGEKTMIMRVRDIFIERATEYDVLGMF